MDEQCLAYPFSNGKNIVRVKLESIIEQPHRKAYFEPRFIYSISTYLSGLHAFIVYRQGLHGLFGWNLVKDSDKEVGLHAIICAHFKWYIILS